MLPPKLINYKNRIELYLTQHFKEHEEFYEK